MGKDREEARRQAVARVLGGEAPDKVGAVLGGEENASGGRRP